MKNLLTIGLVFSILGFGCRTLFADDTALVHAAAHIGISGLITYTTYGLVNTVFGFKPGEKWKPLVITAVIVFAGTSARQVITRAEAKMPLDFDKFGYNAIGISSAELGLVLLRFP